MTPLVINEEICEQLRALRELAEANPVNVVGLVERLKIPENQKYHTAQMDRQSIEIPLAYMVTFSIEHGHPVGPCRHMSMSVNRRGRVPSPAGLWMVAEKLGFWGGLPDCIAVWAEDLPAHGKAMNVVQPVNESA